MQFFLWQNWKQWVKQFHLYMMFSKTVTQSILLRFFDFNYLVKFLDNFFDDFFFLLFVMSLKLRMKAKQKIIIISEWNMRKNNFRFLQRNTSLLFGNWEQKIIAVTQYHGIHQKNISAVVYFKSLQNKIRVWFDNSKKNNV